MQFEIIRGCNSSLYVEFTDFEQAFDYVLGWWKSLRYRGTAEKYIYVSTRAQCAEWFI